MESLTKNRQSTETLRRLIERAYGPGQVPTDEGFAEEIIEGWFNVAYRITLRDGRRVVLKIAPPAGVEVLTREVGMMSVELEAMRLVSTLTAVPVPHVDHVDTSTRSWTPTSSSWSTSTQTTSGSQPTPDVSARRQSQLDTVSSAR